MMAEMIKEYADMLDSGKYDNETDLCNNEQLNYDDLYEDEEYEE